MLCKTGVSKINQRIEMDKTWESNGKSVQILVKKSRRNLALLLCLMQNERNQSLSGRHALEIKPHSSNDNFAEKLSWDQFITSLTCEALRVNLIGNGLRHSNTTQTKDVIKVVKKLLKLLR